MNDGGECDVVEIVDCGVFVNCGVFVRRLYIRLA